MCWKKQPLREVSQDELMKFRLSGKTGALIKSDNKLYLARLNKHSSLPTATLIPNVCSHSLCEDCGKIPDSCPKISALTLSLQLGIGRTFPDAVMSYGRIEKYDFITSAIEFFNNKASNCLVFECENFAEREVQYCDEQYFAETI